MAAVSSALVRLAATRRSRIVRPALAGNIYFNNTTCARWFASSGDNGDNNNDENGKKLRNIGISAHIDR